MIVEVGHKRMHLGRHGHGGRGGGRRRELERAEGSGPGMGFGAQMQRRGHGSLNDGGHEEWRGVGEIKNWWFNG